MTLEKFCLNLKNSYFEASKKNKYIFQSRKFYIRMNNAGVDSVGTGRIVIAHLLP